MRSADAQAQPSPPTAPPSNENFDEQVQRSMPALYPHLTAEERRRLSTLLGTRPANETKRLKREILARSPADAAAFLRSSIFPMLRAST